MEQGFLFIRNYNNSYYYRNCIISEGEIMKLEDMTKSIEKIQSYINEAKE